MTGESIEHPPERVLVVHERYQHRGGEDGVVDAEVELLASRGHAVERLDVDNAGIPERDGLVGRLGLAADTIWSRAGVRTVRDAVRAFRPDIVHVHNTFPLLSPAVLGTARSAGSATVQTLHNYRLVCPKAILFRDGQPCEDCVGRPLALPGVIHACYRGSRAGSAVVAGMLAVHRARATWRRDVDRFIVLAGFACDRLVRGGVPRDRIAILPNFVPSPGPAVAHPGDGLLYVGRITADKGVGTLLEAWRAASIPGELRIAGDGPMLEAVHAAAREDPSIRPLGRLDRNGVLAEMRRARAVVVPSLNYEGCPLSVLEAFATGRPVIASRHGALAEMVVEGGTGLLFRPGHAGELGEALKTAAAGPEVMLEMGRAARIRFEARYSPEVAYDGHRAVFREAIEHRRGADAAR